MREMMNYKDGMQLIASEIAWERYDKDFYDLPQDLQCAIFDEAATQYVERRLP